MSEELSEIAKLLDQSNQSICMAAGLNGSRKIEKKMCVCGTMDFYRPTSSSRCDPQTGNSDSDSYSFTLMKLDR